MIPKAKPNGTGIAHYTTASDVKAPQGAIAIKIPVDESIFLRGFAPAGMQEVLIQSTRIEGPLQGGQ
jgi:hypothetical protein